MRRDFITLTYAVASCNSINNPPMNDFNYSRYTQGDKNLANAVVSIYNVH